MKSVSRSPIHNILTPFCKSYLMIAEMLLGLSPYAESSRTSLKCALAVFGQSMLIPEFLRVSSSAFIHRRVQPAKM